MKALRTHVTVCRHKLYTSSSASPAKSLQAARSRRRRVHSRMAPGCFATALSVLITGCVVGWCSGAALKLQKRQYILCECSPTTRGYRTDAYDELEKRFAELQEEVDKVVRDGKTREELTSDVVDKTSDFWMDCVAEFSTEECVNADTALRVRDCTGSCGSFCEYDPGTWKNYGNGEVVPACDSDSKWKSKSPAINDGKFPAGVNRSASNPNPGAPQPPPKRTDARNPERPGEPVSSIAVGEDAAVVPPGTKFGKQQQQQPSAAGSISGGSGEGGTSEKPAADGTSLDISSVSGGAEVSSEPLLREEIPAQQGSPPLNEGCVAVEHLTGYVLQHRRHLLREVLCAEGFCATDNHALIVDGAWTSMAHLCSSDGGWHCVRTVKLVNNLKVAVNRRVKVSDRITVTPFDARYPRVAVWAVQIAEDCIGLLVSALVLAGLGFMFVLIACAVKDF